MEFRNRVSVVPYMGIQPLNMKPKLENEKLLTALKIVNVSYF
jgi:hypothetical protein